MIDFLDSHPALAAVGTVLICFIVLWRIIIRRLEKQDRRSAIMLRRLDVKLARTEGSLKSGVHAMTGALTTAAGSLSSTSDSMEARQERMRREMEEKLELMRVSTESRLNALSDKLGADMQQALETRLGESFKLVSSQLESVYKGLGEMQALAQSVGDLKKVLTGVKTRGVWGEVRLKALLEQDLPRGSWVENACVKQGSLERVEFCVKMPGKSEDNGVLLPIDSKFPAEDHARLVTARENGDSEEEKRCRKALENAILEQAKRIATKYINPPVTTDFAVMFLPTESLYAEVLLCDGLAERLQSQFKVLPVGPTNLSALLSCLQMGFRTLAVEKRSGEILSMLGSVRRDFAAFGETIDKARTKLEQAAGELDSVGSKTRALNKKLGDMEKLDAPTAENE